METIDAVVDLKNLEFKVTKHAFDAVLIETRTSWTQIQFVGHLLLRSA